MALVLPHSGSVGCFKLQQARQKYPQFYALFPTSECKRTHDREVTTGSPYVSATYLNGLLASIFLAAGENTYHCGDVKRN